MTLVVGKRQTRPFVLAPAVVDARLRSICIRMWATAASWGSAGLLLAWHDELSLLLGVSLAMVSMTNAMIYLSLPYWPALRGCIVLSLAPLMLSYLLGATRTYLILGGCGCLYMFGLLSFARSQHEVLAEAIRSRLRESALLERMACEQRRAEEARLLAERANSAKSFFFAAASHDLRQPLHAIGLLTESLDNDESILHWHAVVKHIVQNVQLLNMMFNQVLDIAKVDAGSMRPEICHFELCTLFEQVEQQFRPSAAEKGLALRIAPTDAVVLGDPILLERVLANLVSNAIRYTTQGAVWIGFRRAGRRLEVRDSGPGIAAENLDHIFDDFFRETHAAHPWDQGYGLGLASVRRILDVLGLQLRVRSAPDKGSTFALRLPEGDLAQVRRVTPDTDVPRFNLHGRRILCINRAASVPEALRLLLARWQCDTMLATDEEAALRCVRSGFEPEALLVDCGLDGGNGVHAILALREFAHRPVPAILITDALVSDLTVRALGHCTVVLHKPVQAARLRRALQHLLEPQSADAVHPL
jgi:signal transduction histidine kinase